MTIGPEVIKKASRMALKLLEHHRLDIEKAYLASEDPLSIPLTLKLKEARGGGLKMEMTINFVPERIKTTIEEVVDEKQLALFEYADDGKVTVKVVKGKDFDTGAREDQT